MTHGYFAMKTVAKFVAAFLFERDLFRFSGDEAVGVVAHDAGDAGFDQKAHVGGLVHGPTDDLEILLARFGKQSGRDQVAANGELAGADFDGALDWIFELAFEEKAGH